MKFLYGTKLIKVVMKISLIFSLTLNKNNIIINNEYIKNLNLFNLNLQNIALKKLKKKLFKLYLINLLPFLFQVFKKKINLKNNKDFLKKFQNLFYNEKLNLMNNFCLFEKK